MKKLQLYNCNFDTSGFFFLIAECVGEQLNNQVLRQERLKGFVCALSAVLSEQAEKPEVGFLFLVLHFHTCVFNKLCLGQGAI